jgi:hypothetical protein
MMSQGFSMRLLAIVMSLMLLANCAAWKPSTKAAANVRTTAELIKKLSRTGVESACDYIAINKLQDLDKCHELQNKFLASVKMAVLLTNKAIDLLEAGRAADASLYIVSALEVLAECQTLLKELGVIE